jgi:hypothetical protein
MSNVIVPNNNGIQDHTINCTEYNKIINKRIQHIGLSAEFIRNDPVNGWVRPVAFSVQPGANNGSMLSAGARFNTGFPSKCFTCNLVKISGGVNENGPSYDCSGQNPTIGINDVLLAKKNYIFSNNKNNVTSGQISGANVYSTNNVGGGSGGGLTKKQIWARVANGYAPSGMPAKRYGLQTQRITTPNLYDISGSATRQPTVITNGRPYIDSCKFLFFPNP